ncbi:MAG TPA: PP2C family protein-serine/threonine phosphatase [Trebonia sp.]|nr:PP2C family protein-serine/threonine phosphatase [Trebonia sp.]
MHLRGGAREQTGTAPPPQRSFPWTARWLELATLVAAAATAAVCLTRAWPSPLELTPLLAVPPALAGIGTDTVKRPLAYGVAAVLADAVIDALLRGGIAGTAGPHQLPLAAAGAIAVTTAVSIAGAKVGGGKATSDHEQQVQQIANVISVAEAVQRALLRPLPEQLGPLKLGVVYLAAAAEARVGGDLYEVASTKDNGIRLIIGDVRGKGLGAVEVAADIIGRFREVAHSAATLNEVAHRLDAGLSRRWGQYEEFVTALLAEIDPDRGKLTILNCGHPPPLLISPTDGVTVLEVRAPAPPLGLLTLGSDAGAKEVFTFKPSDQLLLYTDGVSEARGASREFYPLDERVKALAQQARPRLTRTGKARAKGGSSTLLDLVRDDLLRHVGARPDDDAALLLVRAPAAWPAAGSAPPITRK